MLRTMAEAEAIDNLRLPEVHARCAGVDSGSRAALEIVL